MLGFENDAQKHDWFTLSTLDTDRASYVDMYIMLWIWDFELSIYLINILVVSTRP